MHLQASWDRYRMLMRLQGNYSGHEAAVALAKALETNSSLTLLDLGVCRSEHALVRIEAQR